jgi:hypothetical protein
MFPENCFRSVTLQWKQETQIDLEVQPLLLFPGFNQNWNMPMYSSKTL